MGIETIYISRHGFRQNWLTPDVWQRFTPTARDPPLAAYGVEQAERIGKWFSSPPDGLPTPEIVFSSPFYRCIQTAVPLSQALSQPIKLENGLGEWYSPTPAGTSALHPRPGPAADLAPLFPQGALDLAYTPTFYPSRKGETLQDLLDRAAVFLSAFLRRVEAEHPDVKTVMLFGHAASVIALGRALTGDKDLEVTAGCGGVTMYGRKAGSDGNIGAWDVARMGMVDHLENGVERNWSFKDAVIDADGDIVADPGVPGTENERNEPCGLAPGMERFLPEGDQAATATASKLTSAL